MRPDADPSHRLRWLGDHGRACLQGTPPRTHIPLPFLQNAVAKAAVKELATLHGTSYTYGPGASTICESDPQGLSSGHSKRLTFA